MAVLSSFRFYLLGVLVLSFSSVGIAYAQNAPILVEELSTAPDDVELSSEAGRTNGIAAPSAASDSSDSFFDADDMVPQGEMSKSGPKKVDPATRPASKFVSVRKIAKADSSTAQLVSAERAMNLGRYDSALHLFDVLYEQNKQDARIAMGRAVTLQKLGRFDEAMDMYEILAGLEPKNIEIQVNMLGLLGTRYPAIALRRLVNLYEKNKSHVGLTAQLAISYAKAGDIPSALRYLGAAASIEPQNANHIYNMAIISDHAGRTKEAVQYYEQALEIDTIYGAGRTIPRDSVYERLAHIR